MNPTLKARLDKLGGRLPVERLRAATIPNPVLDAVVRVRAALGLVTALGWSVAVAMVACYVAGQRGAWAELDVLAWMCLVVLALAGLFVLGRTRVEATLTVDPQRVGVDRQVLVAADVTNTARTPLLPLELALPVGESIARFLMPVLGPGASHQETFVVPTIRRGVFEVGPVTTRRGDPLGLMSRDISWTESVEVFVRPRMAPLDSLAGGLLRDLEGVSIEQISHSDLAFHALREYVPGDDLRHVHWRSSAKAGQLLVRQYLDTRRNHATVIVDQQLEAYGSDDDFEVAMSVAASVIARAVTDGFEVTFACGQHVASGADGGPVLDACCRALPGTTRLRDMATRTTQLAPDTSLLFLISGNRADFRTLREAVSIFPQEVARYALTIDPESPTGVGEAGGLPLLRLHQLRDLPMLLHGTLR